MISKNRGRGNHKFSGFSLTIDWISQKVVSQKFSELSFRNCVLEDWFGARIYVIMIIEEIPICEVSKSVWSEVYCQKNFTVVELFSNSADYKSDTEY